MKKAIVCTVNTRAQAESIIQELTTTGFGAHDISVLMSDSQGTKDFAHEYHTKAPEGAIGGVAAGGVVGGTLGLLMGLGALAIPGLGAFIAAGPIMAALAGAGVGGAVGGLTGALIGMGIPEYEAKRYEGIVKKGGILVSVHFDNSEWTDRAKKIFKDLGAEDVDSTGESKADIKTDNRGNVVTTRARVDTPPAGSAY